MRTIVIALVALSLAGCAAESVGDSATRATNATASEESTGRPSAPAPASPRPPSPDPTESPAETAAPAVTPSLSAASTWETVNDADCQFSVAVPPGSMPSYGATDCYSFFSFDDGPAVDFSRFATDDLPILVSDPLTSAEAHEIADGYYAYYADAAAARDSAVIDDLPAFVSVYEWTNEDTGDAEIGWLLVVRRGTWIYTIDCWGDADDRDGLRATFDAMIGTFSFTD